MRSKELQERIDFEAKFFGNGAHGIIQSAMGGDARSLPLLRELAADEETPECDRGMARKALAAIEAAS